MALEQKLRKKDKLNEILDSFKNKQTSYLFASIVTVNEAQSNFLSPSRRPDCIQNYLQPDQSPLVHPY
jgi:hypothetical protein